MATFLPQQGAPFYPFEAREGLFRRFFRLSCFEVPPKSTLLVAIDIPRNATPGRVPGLNPPSPPLPSLPHVTRTAQPREGSPRDHAGPPAPWLLHTTGRPHTWTNTRTITSHRSSWNHQSGPAARRFSAASRLLRYLASAHAPISSSFLYAALPFPSGHRRLFFPSGRCRGEIVSLQALPVANLP